MSFSDSKELQVLDGCLGGPALVLQPTVFLGLSTADPLDDGSGLAEVVGGAYARVSITNNATNWPAATGPSSLKTNGVLFQFPQATASWGTITHAVLFDAAVGGNIMCSFLLAPSITVTAGIRVEFPPGSLNVTLD